MKASPPLTSRNYISTTVLVVCVFTTAAAFSSIWEFFNDSELGFVQMYSVWTTALLTTLIVFLVASLVKLNRSLHANNELLVDIDESRSREEALRESEARYRIVTESASDAIMTIDQDHTILFVNPAAEKIFGYALDEMLGQKLFMLIPEALRDVHAEGMKRYEATNQRHMSWQGVELPALHKDGHEVLVEITFGEISRDGQRLFTAVVRDITQREQANEEFQRNLSLLTSTFEATTDGILVVDRENKIVTYNRNFVEMAGVPDDVISTKDNDKVINSVLDQLADPETFMEKTRLLVQQPENHGYDIVEFKDGRILERHSHPHVSGGEVVGRVVSFRDVTERRRSEIESQVISKIIQGVATTAKLDELIALVQQSIAQVIYAENFYVALYDERTELLNVPFCMDKFDTCAPPQKLGKGLTAYVFRRGLPTLLTDADVRDLCDRGEVESVGTASAVWLGIPLRTPTGVIGVLVVQHYDDETAYAERDIELLTSVGDQIALAIERKRAEDALRESADNLAAAQRITHLGSWELDLDDLDEPRNNQSRWSDETFRIFGFEPGQIDAPNQSFYNAIHPDDNELIAQALDATLKEGQPYNFEHRIILPDKSERIVHERAELIYDDETGRPIKLLGTVQDITDRRRTDAALNDSEYKLRTLFTSMNEGLSQVDNDEVIQFVNDRLCEMTGYEREEMIGQKTLDLLFDDEGRNLILEANKERKLGISGQYEARMKKKSGELIWVLVSGAPVLNEQGVLTGTIGMFMDISERKLSEEQLLHDAFHDGLTGVANRALFMDHLQMTIERCKSRHSNYYAVLFIDIDRFKMINDSLGHAEGDELLRQIAGRLSCITRTGDLLGRLGGDEFVLLLCELLEANDAVDVAERIQDILKKPFDLSGNEVNVSASIGIALSTDGRRYADDMLRDADIAMYQAKAAGKACHKVFNAAMRTVATTRLEHESEIRLGIERGEFELHYQPIVRLETNVLRGFEALVRWQHPTRGLVQPDEFIPTAEETGLILPLGLWILNESCRQMSEWQEKYEAASSLMINVNLSGKQFLQTDLAEMVSKTLTETGLTPQCLKLEITESFLIENSENAVKIMHDLRRLGVGLSLDDFGTGYSSLSYLDRLPLNSLKIDRSFVRRMSENGERSEIVRTIIRLAQHMRMEVIAEGIETVEQLAQLIALQCGYGQGYFLSVPLDPEQAEEYIVDNLVGSSAVIQQPVEISELSL
ncbi:MAG: EAL domain-containing protein [Acidobacteriota bacterium]